MGNWCFHASSFIFYQIIREVAGNQDRHKSSVEFDFGPDQTTHFGVTCPWVTKISHFWTWISLKPVCQCWSNFMCSIIGVGERLHKVLGQIDLSTLDSGERSLPFGLLVFIYRRAGGIKRSVCPYVRPYVRPSEDQAKMFGQGRISIPINGSKLIFHMRIYHYETSRNIQEPWPHDLYFTVHWLRTLARLSRLRFLSNVESQDLLMVASWDFIWGCISMRPAGIYKSHDLLTYIHGLLTSDFGQFSMVNIVVLCRFLSYTDGRSWYFTRGFTSVSPAASALMQVFMLGSGARGQYLGHHRFCLISMSSVTQTLIWNMVHGPVILHYIFKIFSDFELFTYFCL